MESLPAEVRDRLFANLDASDIKNTLSVNKEWHSAVKEHVRTARPELSHTPDISELQALHGLPLPVFFAALVSLLAFQATRGQDTLKHYVRVYREDGVARCMLCAVPLLLLAQALGVLAWGASSWWLAAAHLAYVCVPVREQVLASVAWNVGAGALVLAGAALGDAASRAPLSPLAALLASCCALAWLMALPHAAVWAAAEHFEVRLERAPAVCGPAGTAWFSLYAAIALSRLLAGHMESRMLLGAAVLLGALGLGAGVALVELGVCLAISVAVVLPTSMQALARAALVGSTIYGCASSARVLAYGKVLPRRSSVALTTVLVGLVYGGIL